jgi:hypothetical protein
MAVAYMHFHSLLSRFIRRLIALAGACSPMCGPEKYILLALASTCLALVRAAISGISLLQQEGNHAYSLASAKQSNAGRGPVHS